MIVKSFGRRGLGTSAQSTKINYVHPGPDPDGETRVIPAEMWNGPRGEELRKAGFTPDDPRNLALTPERGRAMEDAATARMNAIVAKVEAHVKGLSVRPWAMIPWAVWEGLNAEFLFKRDFFPSSPWNNMLLPIDDASSAHLELPLHPRVAMPDLNENVTRLVTELRMEAADAFQTQFAELATGDWSALDRHTELKNKQFQHLFAMARYIAADIFGKEVCDRHDELFGIGLSDVPE